MRSLLLLSLLATLGAGCDSIGDCPQSSEPAVTIDVLDPVSAGSVDEDPSGTLTDGAFSDSLLVLGSAVNGEAYFLGGAYDRPGTYDVRVQKRGYRDWTREGVRVRSGACGPATVHLTARLVPE